MQEKAAKRFWRNGRLSLRGGSYLSHGRGLRRLANSFVSRSWVRGWVLSIGHTPSPTTISQPFDRLRTGKFSYPFPPGEGDKVKMATYDDWKKAADKEVKGRSLR